MSPSRQLQRIARRIASGELRGEAAFEAVVSAIAVEQTPVGAGVEDAARIRDEVALGVRHDRALCELLYRPRPAVPPEASPRPPAADWGPPASPPAPAPASKPPVPRPERPPRAQRERGSRPPGGRARPGSSPARPADDSVEELPPSARRRRRQDAEDPVDVETMAQMQAQARRNRIVTGAATLGALALLAGLYYGFSTSPCETLATEICATLGETCRVDDVRARFHEQGLNATVCSTAREATQSQRSEPPAYRAALRRSLGFDVLGEEAPAAPADAPPPEPVAIVAGQTTMASLIVDRSHLYWTVTQPPAVYRIPSIGGEPELLSQTPMPGQLGLSENFVYWLSAAPGAPKMWADKIRGEHEAVAIDLVEGFSPSRVAFMGPEAAFIDGVTGAVHIVAVADDTPRPLAGPTAPPPVSIAGNGTTVVWATAGPSATLMAAPREGGTARTVAQGLSAADHLTLDATRAYWADVARGTIATVALEGGAPTVLVTAEPGISDLAVDDEDLYWSNATTGNVSVVPKRGGPSRVVVTGLQAPRYVTLDGAAVFWESGGVVYRLPK